MVDVTLDDWMDRVCSALGVPVPDRRAVLDMARDVAHGVARPAAPLTAFVAGVAAGREGGGPQAVERALADVLRLVPPPAEADRGRGQGGGT